MVEMKRWARNGLMLTAGLMLAGCSWLDTVMPDRRPDYKTAKPVETLEVPPDLTSSTLDDSLVVPEFTPSSTATLSDYANERQGQQPRPGGGAVLPSQQDMEVRRDGDKAWLLVQGDAAQLWPKARDFWLQNGFLLQREDPRVGIMETSWAENRADIADDPIRRVLGKVLDPLYSASTRDKFRLRLETGEQAGTSEVYVTHRGMEEVIQGTPGEGQTAVWRPRPNDPELEIEMLKRLMVHLGIEEQRAEAATASATQAPARAELVKGGDGVALTLLDDFSRAWRRTGVALDRTGFAVEDRDRAKGIYFVRYIDPDKDAEKPGWLSKLGFGGDDDDEQSNQYQIKLTATGPRTEVQVLDQQGEQERSRTAERILSLLHEQLR